VEEKRRTQRKSRHEGSQGIEAEDPPPRVNQLAKESKPLDDEAEVACANPHDESLASAQSQLAALQTRQQRSSPTAANQIESMYQRLRTASRKWAGCASKSPRRTWGHTASFARAV